MSPVNGDLSVISSVTTVSDLPGLYPFAIPLERRQRALGAGQHRLNHSMYNVAR